jgi:mannose-6-phosphate isomerase-like protein (cupin superfamily)
MRSPSQRVLARATPVASAVVLAAVAALAEPSPVTHFDAADVNAAFAKGAVLFDGQGTNYMIHASRRDTPGKCEIHARDTDVIYVLEGKATFVTGGTCTEPAPSGPDEIRGTAVADGDVRELAPGDVVLVPANTPHWFQRVGPPLRYFVVKVR